MMDSAEAFRLLKGLKVLVVEDQYFVAEEHAYFLEGLGAEVIGPFGTVAEALKGLKDVTPDLALLDVNLEGEKVFPIADELARRHTPFLFITGYEAWVLPPNYQDRPVLEKPFSQLSFMRAFELVDIDAKSRH